jgi:uncharacterized protein (DUF302 family)
MNTARTLLGLAGALAALLLATAAPAAETRAAAKPAATGAQAGTIEMKIKIIRMPVKEGVSFDDAVESLKLRANTRNFKFVGHAPLSKEVEAVTGKSTLRTEIFSFCDAVTAREFLDVSKEFAAFLPCRVTLLEDENKKIWIVSMLMDMSMLDRPKGAPQVPEKLRKRAAEIIDIMDDMIKAAANGDI